MYSVLTAQPVNFLFHHNEHITIYHFITDSAIHGPFITIRVHAQLGRRVAERAVNGPVLFDRHVE